MSLEHQAARSSVVSIFVIATAVGSAVFGVTRYYHEQNVSKIEQEFQVRLGQAETELARLDVGLGDVRGLDLKQIVCPRSEVLSIPESAAFFDQDSFYAIRSDETWNYSLTTESEIFERMSGESLDDTELGGVANLIPVHLWSSDQSCSIMHDGQRIEMTPMIMMQRIPLARLRQLAGMAEKTSQSVVRQASYETVSEVSEPGLLYDTILEDMTGKFFQFQMWLELGQSLNSANTSHHLKQVQKLSDKLYSRSTTVMKDAEVNGVLVPAFYVHNQMILISNRDGLYYIKIVMPASEPALRDKATSAVNRWLANLRIIVD